MAVVDAFYSSLQNSKQLTYCPRRMNGELRGSQLTPTVYARGYGNWQLYFRAIHQTVFFRNLTRAGVTREQRCGHRADFV